MIRAILPRKIAHHTITTIDSAANASEIRVMEVMG
jgi:hypothetical protein